MSEVRQRNHADDGDLLHRCARGDDIAWVDLLGRYEGLVFSVPLNYGLSRDEAADIAQSVFTELLRNIDSVRDPSALGSWLATVARRTTWRTISRRTPDRLSVDTVDPDPDVDPWHDWMDTWTDRTWVVEAVLALASPCRDLLVFLYLDPDQPTYEEVATRMGRPLGSIGPTRGRCLDKLRTAMIDLDEHA